MRILLLLTITVFLTGCNKKDSSKLKAVKVLNEYPSGSGIAFADNKIYLMGDDAAYLLVMDTALNQVDTLNFFSSTEKRIPKDIKQDLEAAAIVTVDRLPAVLFVGSGSLPHRSTAWLLDPRTKEKRAISLDTFYARLKIAGIKDLNIEGLAEIPGGIILSSRGNKNYPKNHLVFTARKFWADQTNAPISIANIGTNTDTSFFNGVSGLEYSKITDRLLLTVSTENTYTSLGDGEIGKSYLWIVNDISTKKAYAGINPSAITDLETIDSRFGKQKIESVCITRDGKKETELLFVSDDDKGGSVLFKAVLSYK